MNGAILRATIGRLRRALGMDDFQLWTFLPTTANFVGTLGETLSVYYCTDEWSGFSHLGREPVADLERTLCRKADVVFTTSKVLLERKAAYNPETHLASHGVDHAHFASALDPATLVAEDIAALPRPILGFFGLIEDWIDLGLIRHLAERRPDWSIVLIGRSTVDMSSLESLPNVHLLGRRPYAELPRYAKAFDVGLCPFVTNELTRNINPIKLREYLSAGLPVVSSGIPEATAYGASSTLAFDHDQFLSACEAAIRDDTPQKRRQRSDLMRDETWESKAEQSLGIALRVKEERRHPTARRAA
jgi:glycosyltransferase involved in cell wall biosynthesis